MSSTSILSGSVGKGGRAANKPADVRSVQHLFNLIDGSITLPETGTCNAALIARIARFQHDVLRYPHPDSRVDPNGRMLKVLLARANDAARVRRSAAAVAKQDETWTHWATSNLGALRRSMQGAWSALMREVALIRRVLSPSPAGKSAGRGGAHRPAPVNKPNASKATDREYADAAARLGRGIDPLLVRALVQVESNGSSGFGPDGLPLTAFEGHWFQRLTKNVYDETHPLLSYRYKKKAGWQWQKNNKDHATSWKTLTAAMELNADAALQSTSWGMCQVLGANFWKAGYKDVFAFVEAMKQGSRGQLDAFVEFCLKTPGMVSALQRKDFVGMAVAYNGDDYGNYDKLFEKNYKNFGGKV
jgi:hypothetical protein